MTDKMRFKRFGQECADRRHARMEDGGHGHHHRHHRFGRGGRLARFLEHGDLRLLVLQLIAEKPRHGYEIIKAIEELAGGAYAPSPGVVYPTLTMLEELGQVEVAAEGSKKLYTVTADGTRLLAENEALLREMRARIAAAQPRDGGAPVIRAMENLRNALKLKFAGADTNGEALTRRIADLLDETARKVEEL